MAFAGRDRGGYQSAREASAAPSTSARSLAQDQGDLNKCLKMAEKSAHIDATLRMGGLSEVFTQDTEDNPDLDFNPPPDADFGSDQDAWRAECEISRDIVAAHDLDDTARPLDWHEDVDLRWLMLRMITSTPSTVGTPICSARRSTA